MLGSTLAVNDKAVEMTSFGETDNENVFFTGKPMIDELGYSFLFRDYNPNQGKWTTSDPLGYPDGWNNLAYCNNGVTRAIDWIGCSAHIIKPVNIYGFSVDVQSEVRLGYWWAVNAKCSGDVSSLNITYEIVATPDSKSTFVAPYLKESSVYDNEAVYSNFSYTVKNIKKTLDDTGMHVWAAVEFELYMQYQVQYKNTYIGHDGVEYYGNVTQVKIMPMEKVVLKCYHRRFE